MLKLQCKPKFNHQKGTTYEENNYIHYCIAAAAFTGCNSSAAVIELGD